MSEGKYTTAEEAIVDSLDRAQKCLDRIFDPAKDKVDHTAILSLINHFNTVVLLEALRRKDPAEADRITRWLEDIHEAGDTTGELVYQWRQQIANGHPMTGIGGHITEPAPPVAAGLFEIAVRDGSRIEVQAVQSATPGLMVSQEIRQTDTGEYKPCDGEWTITFADGGRALGCTWPVDTALKVAERLGSIGLDWTRGGHSLANEPDGIRAHGAEIRAVFDEFASCRYCTDADHLPVLPWRATPNTEAGAA